MSIHGFMDQNGQIQKYDYNDLENKPTIPAEVLIDGTLTEEGQAADAKAVGDAIANISIPVDDALSENSMNPVQNRVIYDALQNSGLSQAAKNALLAIFQHVAYVDEHGQEYYDDLEEALNGGQSYTITYNLTGCASSNTSISIIEGRTYFATITADSGYTLDGATATATMGGQTVTGFYNNGTITIPNVTGDLVITVTATSAITSISAVFTQGANVVYTNDSLDTLRQYLVITATYSDSATETVTDYTLSGTLGEGTRTITASYGGKTDTFDVVCTVNGYLYHFNQSLASAGTKDFGWSGPENYGAGYDGSGYSYGHLIVDGVDQGSIKNTSLTSAQKPDLSGDFTVSAWFYNAAANNLNVYVLSSIKYETTSSSYDVTNAVTSLTSLATGWTADLDDTISKRYKGFRLCTISGKLVISMFASDDTNRAGVRLTPPSGFSLDGWHHWALTRKNGTVRLFADGALICSFAYNKALYFNSQVTTCATFKANADDSSSLISFQVNTYVDDLFVSDYCKWDAAFDASTITY